VEEIRLSIQLQNGEHLTRIRRNLAQSKIAFLVSLLSPFAKEYIIIEFIISYLEQKVKKKQIKK
jgi:hypothetical protein